MSLLEGTVRKTEIGVFFSHLIYRNSLKTGTESTRALKQLRDEL